MYKYVGEKWRKHILGKAKARKRSLPTHPKSRDERLMLILNSFMNKSSTEEGQYICPKGAIDNRRPFSQWTLNHTTLSYALHIVFV